VEVWPDAGDVRTTRFGADIAGTLGIADENAERGAKEKFPEQEAREYPRAKVTGKD